MNFDVLFLHDSSLLPQIQKEEMSNKAPIGSTAADESDYKDCHWCRTKSTKLIWPFPLQIVELQLSGTIDDSFSGFSSATLSLSTAYSVDLQDMFTKSIKKNVEVNSTPRDENGNEVGAVERNMPTRGDEETEEANEDNIVNLLRTVPDKQLLNTWIDVVGRPKKKKIYGLGLQSGFQGDPLHVSSSSSTAPAATVTSQQIAETPEFKQILNRVLDQRMAYMQESIQASIRAVMQEEIEAAVRVVMSRMLGFAAAGSNGSGSPSDLP
ncbi:hypothetical protein HAX54_001253 [Datura stramonium]|uniref:Uncharacterized protein n=1 Tax=Datura stramonium TaxID=4076 RepID=A0ABS8T237_DATST|nr:hypothetical protein [Datura stramonium]